MARAYGDDAAVRCCALIMRDAAMSSNALVIFCVDFTARIRLRYSRSCPAISAALLPDDALLLDVAGVQGLGRLVPGRDRRCRATDEVALELTDRVPQGLLGVLAELAGLPDGVEDLAVPAQLLEQLALEPADVLDGHVVEQPARAGEDRDDLLLHRERR